MNKDLRNLLFAKIANDEEISQTRVKEPIV